MLRIGLVCYLALLFSGVAHTQSLLGYGVKGGVALTNDYSAQNSGFGIYSKGDDYLVGPFVELHFLLGFSVEGDAIYRSVNLIDEPSQFIGILAQGNYTSWEFPVLAKYRLKVPAPIIKPLIEAGPSFRAHANSLPDLRAEGFIVGGGVEFKVPLIRLSSELRYTRWASPGTTAISSPNANQVELLFGIGF